MNTSYKVSVIRFGNRFRPRFEVQWCGPDPKRESYLPARLAPLVTATTLLATTQNVILAPTYAQQVYRPMYPRISM